MRTLFLLLLIAALPAAAQWRRFDDYPARPTGYVGVGFASPVNPVAARLDTGWSVSGGVGVTSRYLGIMLDANLTGFGINSETLRRLGVPRGSHKYWSVTANPVFHVNQRGPVDFYITGGGGLYSRIVEYRERGGGGYFSGGGWRYSDIVYKPGVNGGAGFAFNVGGFRNNIRIYTEARFHHMFVGRSGASYIPVSLGVRF